MHAIDIHIQNARTSITNMKNAFFVLLLAAESLYAPVLNGMPTTQSEVTSVIGTENGHEYVDLGLSVKWATMNIGASSSEESGSYFAWGETMPKMIYYNKNYKFKGNPDTLPPKVDAATVNWGGRWRMPTKAEFLELMYYCTWSWTTVNDSSGYLVTSKKNGNSIYLPAAGYIEKQKVYYTNEQAIYCSSSLCNRYPQTLYFKSTEYDIYNEYCPENGMAIRPVLGDVVPLAEQLALESTIEKKKEEEEKLRLAQEKLLLDALIQQVGQVDSTRLENGHEYVDMGVSVYWATMNVGSRTPSDPGDRIAWGETKTKSEFTPQNYTYEFHTEIHEWDENTMFIEYKPEHHHHVQIETHYLPQVFDAASANWGGDWRMPTPAECQDLLDNCTYKWATINGRNGYLLTSKINGNTIFLPDGGGYNYRLNNRGCTFWSSANCDNTNYSHGLTVFSDLVRVDHNLRHLGYYIRPVRPSPSAKTSLAGDDIPDNVILYRAKGKLRETEDKLGYGLHPYNFDGIAYDKAIYITITNHTFSNGVGTITFSGAVTELELFAFFGCADLCEILLPATVRKIEAYTFSGCRVLDEITCRATVPPAVGENAFPHYRTLYVPAESVSAYRNAEEWKKFKNILAIPR